jgi:hypothetical protein
MDLQGNEHDGYIIPDGWEDFYDVIFTPRSPISGLVMTADWGQNIYLQYYYSLMAGGGGYMNGLLTDYYLTMSAMRDASIVLGFTPTWSVYGHKLFIHPVPSTDLKIGLKKKRMPTPDEINKNIWLKRYTLALAKMKLGELRELINSIPNGNIDVPLNGAALKAEGLAERDKIDQEWMKLMEPMFLQKM